ncbi:MAG: tetratricopeptide repeat protein [Bacteroidales bacterium]|jgi:tetratricopeptide (TPR) repeat protein|nr:tetratricopeptide repeat protein [Bacteroidales bacterium]
MKKLLVILLALVISISGFAQSKNLKNAEKNLKKNKLDAALNDIHLALQEEANLALPNLYLAEAKAYTAVIYNLNDDSDKRKPEYDALMKDEYMSKAIECFKKTFSMDANGLMKALNRTEIDKLALGCYNYGVNKYSANDFAAASNAFMQSYYSRLLNEETDTNALYNAAMCADRAGDKENAKKLYQQVIDMNTKNFPSAYISMANIYVPIYQEANQKVDSAKLELNKAKMTLEDAQYTLKQAQADEKETAASLKTIKNAATKQQYQDYIKIFQDKQVKAQQDIDETNAKIPALEADKTKNEAIALNNQKEAGKYANLAVEHFPDDYNTLINAASIHLMIGNSDKAEKILNDMTVKYSDNKVVFFALGISYYMMDNPTKAEEAYFHAMSLDPDYYDAYYNLGVLYVTEGQKLAIEANNLPLNATAEYETKTAQANDYFKKSIPLLEKSLAAQPNNTSVMSALRDIYNQLGKSDVEYLKKAADMRGRIEALGQ